MSSPSINAVKSLNVLVVEDSPRMAAALLKGLNEEGFSVTVRHDGVEGLEAASTGDFDLVLLDVNLPRMDGFTFVRELRRRRSDVPVIMVTARDGVQDRIEGLDGGADDYMVKPFAFEELLARIRALMRRPGSRGAPVLAYGDIAIDPASGQATRAGRNLPLSMREFSLLRVFLANQNRVMSRAELLAAVWSEPASGSNVLEVYVNYLRNKLEENGSRVIYTVRGQGYVLGAESHLRSITS